MSENKKKHKIIKGFKKKMKNMNKNKKITLHDIYGDKTLTLDDVKQIYNLFSKSCQSGTQEETLFHDRSEDCKLIEDMLYKKFINNIADNKIKDKRNIILIAKELKKFQNITYNRW